MKNYFNLNGIPKIEHKTIKYKRNQFLTRKNTIELIFIESFMASYNKIKLKIFIHFFTIYYYTQCYIVNTV